MNKIKITYASKSEHNFAQRLVIKTIERATGSKKLEKLYKEYSKETNDPRFFWTNILKIMDIKITNKSKVNLEIPPSGPLLLISNHPFGIIDGLILCSLASKVRSDFKIMTHETLKLIPELDRFILPIDFGGKDKKTIKNKTLKGPRKKQHFGNFEGAIRMETTISNKTLVTWRAQDSKEHEISDTLASCRVNKTDE